MIRLESFGYIELLSKVICLLLVSVVHFDVFSFDSTSVFESVTEDPLRLKSCSSYVLSHTVPCSIE
jgi:hypothetical protein